MRLAEVKTLCPEEDEEHSSVVLRHRDRLGRPVDQESEEEEYFKEELEMMESRKHRHAGFEASYEKRRANKTDGRYLRGIVHFLLCVFMLKHVIKQLACRLSLSIIFFQSVFV